MAILFNRKEAQEFCESIAKTEQGLDQYSNDYIFKNMVLNNHNVINLLDCCYRDAVGFYFNSLVSFAQGISLICKKHYSWASIQLYYSVYYACRAILGFDKYIIIRKGDLFLLKVSNAEKTKKLKERNDHKMTIDSYKDIYKNDFLMSNIIENVDFYTWMTELREITNYKQNHFKEPYCLNIFTKIESELKSGKKIGSLLEHYSTDWNLYCFQEEFTAIAGPYHLITDAYQKYILQPERISTSQRKYLEKLFKEINWTNIISSII